MRTIGKAIFVCLLLFVGLCVILAVRDNVKSGGSATNENNRNGEESETSAESAQRVSALKLFLDYQRNEVAADNIYKGHLLTVVGQVTSINKDLFDKIYVSLATPNEFMNVQAHLNEGSESQAAALQRGQVVTLLCTGAGMVVGSPMLKDCSFARLRDDTQSGQTASQPPPKQIVAQPSDDGTNGAQPPATQEESTENSVPEKVGGGVSAPVLVSKSESEFPDAARQANMGATVLVHLIVDRNGLPTNVQVVRTVYVDRDGHASGGLNGGDSNLGFNESAVDSVRKYRFKPAIENGKPVPVEIEVSVNFQTP